MGRRGSARSLSGPSQSQSALPHKLRGPNWTEQEMLVLIGQKCIEWDGRHNCSQPSLAKFVYGTTAWKLVLAGCMAVVGFWARDADQLTNKWDGLIKDYKKLKDYMEGTGSANWWGMNREENRDLCKTIKLPLEFNKCMYNEMKIFVGKRQIFGHASDVVDSDCLGSPPTKTFGRSPLLTTWTILCWSNQPCHKCDNCTHLSHGGHSRPRHARFNGPEAQSGGH